MGKRLPLATLLIILTVLAFHDCYGAPGADQEAEFAKLVSQLKSRKHHVVVSANERNTIQDLELNDPDYDDLRLLRSARVSNSLKITGLKNKVVRWDTVLKGCESIAELTFVDCQFVDDRIDFVSACPNLTDLRLLDNCPLDGRGLAVLERLPKLEHFIAECKAVNNHSAEIPKDHPTLFDFDLFNVPIDKSNFRRLMGLSHVRFIRLSGNGTTDDHLLGITPSGSLENVYVLSGISDTAGSRFRDEHDGFAFTWDK